MPASCRRPGNDPRGNHDLPLGRILGFDEVDQEEFELFGRRETVRGEQELEDADQRIRANGMYPHRMTSEEVARVSALSADERETWFAEVMLHTFDRWLALAAERLDGTDVRFFLMPGNDDPPGVDASIERAGRVEACDDRIVEFDGHAMVSHGY